MLYPSNFGASFQIAAAPSYFIATRFGKVLSKHIKSEKAALTLTLPGSGPMVKSDLDAFAGMVKDMFPLKNYTETVTDSATACPTKTSNVTGPWVTNCVKSTAAGPHKNLTRYSYTTKYGDFGTGNTTASDPKLCTNSASLQNGTTTSSIRACTVGQRL